MRGRSCEAAVAQGSNGPEDTIFAQCEDFVGTGGITGQDGSCCKVDGNLFDGWCLKVRSLLLNLALPCLWEEPGSHCDPDKPFCANEYFVARQRHGFDSQSIILRFAGGEPRQRDAVGGGMRSVVAVLRHDALGG